MSSNSEELKGRRGFFLAMVAGVGDVVAEAVSAIEPRAATIPPPAMEPASAEPAPVLRRTSVPPTSIPDVRS